MENLKDKNLALFLNYYSGLQVWDKFGMLSREISLYNRLAEKFKTVYIFSYGGVGESEYGKYLKGNVIIIPKRIRIPDVLYEPLIPFLHADIIRGCDILKTNQNSGTIAPSIAKLIYRKKLVVRSGYIGSEFARLNKLPLYAKLYFFLAENISYRFCDKAFIPKSDFDTLKSKYPFLKDRLVGMNNFVDTDLFIKKELPKKYDIIYIARFDAKQKNHQGLLEAVAGLGLKVLLIGRGSDKEKMIGEAERKNTKLEIIERVSNEEIPNYYGSSKICVFPSLFEGNPKALLEAMSCEMPIVACEMPGIGNLIENGKSGLLSEPKDDLIRKNILKLLDDQELGKELGGNARKFILENYSLDNIFTKETDIYKNLFRK